MEGENIPIGRLSQEGPGFRQAPGVDPYKQAPAPGLRTDHTYGAPYGSRSESSYGPRSDSRYGRSTNSDNTRAFPRAHL